MLEDSDPRHEVAANASSAVHVVVIGTGYVGLVTAACLAAVGHCVTAVDVDAQKIRCLERGVPPFHEVGLATLVQAQIASRRLRFTTTAGAAIVQAEVVFIAVGTPACSDGSTDLRAVDAVIRELREVVRAPTVIVMKSTVPVGTAHGVQAALAAACDPGTAPRVLSNPEFLREGCAIDDFMHPERIILGDDSPTDERPRRLIARLYAPLLASGAPLLTMDTRSAELSKYAANAMLAMRISFINELASITVATGGDIEHVRAGIGSDPRIGHGFLQPGLGFGGSCFPKDIGALRATARRHGLRSDLLLAIDRVNRRQHGWAVDALVRDLGTREALRGLRVALWGLAFKPDTDDMRDAPSLVILKRLLRGGAIVAAYDPVATANARSALGHPPNLYAADSAAAALEGADVLLLATEWPEFALFEPRVAAAALAKKAVYDGRNMLEPSAWSAAGLRLMQVGRARPCRARPCAEPALVSPRTVAASSPASAPASAPAFADAEYAD